MLGLFVFRMPYDEVAGIVAGACGNPAILAYSNKLAPTDRPDIGYAMIFPGMTIVKILFVEHRSWAPVMTKSGQAAKEALSARSFLNAESTESGVNGPKTMEMFGFNAYSPQEVARLVQNSGAAKARLPLLSQVMLSVLGGAFIGMGALYFVVIRSDPALGYAAKQVLGGGFTFCLGLVMVVVAGAELFTGNNLLVMARARGLISTTEVLRNWAIVFWET